MNKLFLWPPASYRLSRSLVDGDGGPVGSMAWADTPAIAIAGLCEAVAQPATGRR